MYLKKSVNNQFVVWSAINITNIFATNRQQAYMKNGEEAAEFKGSYTYADLGAAT